MTAASCSGQERLNAISDLGRASQDVGLPKAEDVPARRAEFRVVLPISLYVPLDLGGPVSGVVAAREPLEAVFKVASVPEVSIAKDRDPMSREDDVWAPRQSRDVEAIPESPPPEFTPKDELAARVRLCTGTSRCVRSAARGRTQPVE